MVNITENTHKIPLKHFEPEEIFSLEVLLIDTLLLMSKTGPTLTNPKVDQNNVPIVTNDYKSQI